MINKLIGESTYEVTYKIGKEKYSFTTRGKSQREVNAYIFLFPEVNSQEMKISFYKVLYMK